VTVNFTELQKNSSAIESPEIKELLALLGKSEIRQLGKDIVEIRSIATDDDPHSTAWFIRIFEAVSFFGFTHPRYA
jgi:hypothetical protein